MGKQQKRKNTQEPKKPIRRARQTVVIKKPIGMSKVLWQCLAKWVAADPGFPKNR